MYVQEEYVLQGEFIQSCLLKICVLHVLESNTSNKEWDESNAICLKENTSVLKFIAN